MRSIPCPTPTVYDPVDWLIVRARLEGGTQAQAVPAQGVLVVDTRVADHLVDAIASQASAAVAGDWARAPHVVRPRPTLHVVPGGAS